MEPRSSWSSSSSRRPTSSGPAELHPSQVEDEVLKQKLVLITDGYYMDDLKLFRKLEHYSLHESDL